MTVGDLDTKSEIRGGEVNICVHCFGRSENGKVLLRDRWERTKGRVIGDKKRDTTRCIGETKWRLKDRFNEHRRPLLCLFHP